MRCRRHRRWERQLLLSASVFALTPNVGSDFVLPSGQLILSEAHAQVARDVDIFADFQPLDDVALEQQRGGFKIGNFDINVGVTVTTTVEGFATVTTNISVEIPGELKDLGSQITEISQAAVEAANVAVEAAKTAVQASSAEGEAQPESQSLTGPAIPQVVSQASNDTANATTTSEATDMTDALSSLDSAQNSLNTAAEAVLQTPQEVIESPASAPVTSPISVGAADSTAPIPMQAPTFDDSIKGDTVASLPVSEGLKAAAQATTEPPSVHTAEAGTMPSVSLPSQVKTESPAVIADAGAIPATAPATVAKQHVATPSAKEIVAAAVAGVPEPVARIVHQTTQSGHTSIISNTLNGVSIQQSVAMNLTVDNFRQVQSMVNIQRNISAISRQIGILSLRH